MAAPTLTMDEFAKVAKRAKKRGGFLTVWDNQPRYPSGIGFQMRLCSASGSLLAKSGIWESEALLWEQFRRSERMLQSA